MKVLEGKRKRGWSGFFEGEGIYTPAKRVHVHLDTQEGEESGMIIPSSTFQKGHTSES
jgi:hypothetical protein